MPDNPSLTKTIVAVHGIGDQTKYETIKKVLRQFAAFHDECDATPLGFFHNKDGVLSQTFKYKCTNRVEDEVVTTFRFAEPYWADIPRNMIKEGFQIEAVKNWGRSIAGRVRQRTSASEKDSEFLEEVLNEALQTIGVLDRLFYLADKMGIFKFDLKRVIEDTLDYVQVVGDFENQRNKILDAFDIQMSRAYAACPTADIYIIAHSEGTVVSLLGMLRAGCQPDVVTEVEVSISPTEKKTLKVKRSDWLGRIRGYMTFGSPIDKHIELWPHIFDGYESPALPNKADGDPPKKIEWRNYYDLNDPVGYELDEARKRINYPDEAQKPVNGEQANTKKWRWGNLFNFRKDGNDFGFTRYPLPGAAHNEYWADKDVFGHFIENVVYEDNKPEKPKFGDKPSNKWWWWPVSYILPYIVDFALLFCAALVLHKALKSYLPSSEVPKDFDSIKRVLGSTCLLAGITFIARITRLTKFGFWWVIGFLFFGAMIYLYCLLPDPIIRYVWMAVFIFGIGWGLNAVFPKWGMRTLLIPGGIAVLGIVGRYLYYNRNGAHGELWPVVLATAFFLYLWWLVALVFDLVFIWHRYIRHSQKNMKVQRSN